MNAIFGFAQLLGDTVTGERERTYVDAITQSGEVLLGLINDLLDMSKIEAGKLDLSPEPVDLRQMFRTCETLFSRIALDKGLRMEWQVDDALPPSLLLDPLRIRQILINLVGNALKNTQHGSVEVRARAEAHDDASGTLTLLLQVTDTGLGIAQDKLSQIFIPFVQLEGPERAASGAGLGLSIVKRLVDLLGGEIRVESQVQRGSCFSVQLPGVLPGTGVASPPQRRAPVIQRLPPLRVLVVDDVTLNRRLIEALFGGERHQVYSAHNGETGVRLAQRERPDLIFMDLRMPGLDGVEAARRIRSLPELASCRIIAATASTLGEEGETGVFDGYLRKPITRGAIEGLLERLFGCAAAPEGQREEPAGAPIAEVWSAADSQSWRGHRQALEDALQRAASTLSSADLRSLLAAIRTLPERPAFRPLLATGADLESAAALFDVVRIESCLAGLRDDLDMLDARATAPV
jgi:CheY-like chemotaxis protein